MICIRPANQLPPHALIPANDFEREIWDDLYVPTFESFQDSRVVLSPRARETAGRAKPTDLPARPATFHDLTRAFEWLTQFAVLSIAIGVLVFLYGIFA